MSILEVTLKLFLAVALGGLVGLERESSRKPAGLRTNVLICVGSAMVMILSGLLLEGKEGSAGDLTRIAAGVITGIGFIGAGTIIQARGMVIGLTTAATLWAVAVLGLVIGSGYYLIALIFSGVIILTLIVFRQFEDFYMKKSLYRYLIKTKLSKETLINIRKIALHEGIKLHEITIKNEKGFTFIRFAFQAPEEKEQKFNQSLLTLEGILEMSIE
ncbi:MAG: MgtC/SapB family protein [Candidatus Aminicenantes bacterium]|nr:MgtC/SapB family protein [Candidatus Aminicenantes bacterium]